MKYLNERLLRELGINWPQLVDVIAAATCLLRKHEVVQPVKPYLRFNDLSNRIIAMPAYIGGQFNAAGIKWIASFPGNIERSMKRAHAVIILNDTATGVPTALINTALISGIRTAAVSGFVLQHYFRDNPTKKLDCGIIGFGPIGKLHAEMLYSCFGDKLGDLYVHDINPLYNQPANGNHTSRHPIFCKDWTEVFEKSSLLITSTVSNGSYIDAQPKTGGIYLNVSLRDFFPEFVMAAGRNVVDSWEEVCREKTDIQHAHDKYGLAPGDVLEIQALTEHNSLTGLAASSFMFHPMGMAIYDIAIAKYYADLAVCSNIYQELED